MTHHLPTDGEQIVLHGDCLEQLRKLPDESITAIVTDPPYGLSNVSPANIQATLLEWLQGNDEAVPVSVKGGYKGAEWDRFVPPPAVWTECLRVLKPGGLLAVFSASRTLDLMGMSLRIAGADIIDTASWVHGGGGVGLGGTTVKTARRARLRYERVVEFTRKLKADAERRGVTARDVNEASGTQMSSHWLSDKSQPAVPNPENWEKIKHLFSDTLDPSEVEPVTDDEYDGDTPDEWEGWRNRLRGDHDPIIIAQKRTHYALWETLEDHGSGGINADGLRELNGTRFHPSNVIVSDDIADAEELHPEHSPKIAGKLSRVKVHGRVTGRERKAIPHPTVKPVEVMRWLVRMLATPGGVILDPFAGSGSTLVAAQQEGVTAIGIEQDETYHALAQSRLEPVTEHQEA